MSSSEINCRPAPGWRRDNPKCGICGARYPRDEQGRIGDNRHGQVCCGDCSDLETSRLLLASGERALANQKLLVEKYKYMLAQREQAFLERHRANQPKRALTVVKRARPGGNVLQRSPTSSNVQQRTTGQ